MKSVETYARSYDDLFHALSEYKWLSAEEAKYAAATRHLWTR